MLQCISIAALLVFLSWIITRIKNELSGRTLLICFSILLLVYIAGNLYCTLLSRVPGSGAMLDLQPFKSYLRMFEEPIEGGGEVTGLFAWFMRDTTPLTGILLNIMLYYPLGYLLSVLFPGLKGRQVLLIGCLCSVATEATQYFLQMGWCETDDVIHNTLGTAIGMRVWQLQERRLARRAQTQ